MRAWSAVLPLLWIAPLSAAELGTWSPTTSANRI
jgi:hypothetical protein